MSDYAICRVCGVVSKPDHRCWPVWDWRETLNFGADEWSEVRGRNAEHAAERAAEEYDGEDYYLARSNANTVIIQIRDRPSGEVTQWRCFAETTPIYYVREAT